MTCKSTYLPILATSRCSKVPSNLLGIPGVASVSLKMRGAHSAYAVPALLQSKRLSLPGTQVSQTRAFENTDSKKLNLSCTVSFVLFHKTSYLSATNICT